MKSALDTNLNWAQSGVVVSMADGVATVAGLDNVLSGGLALINNVVKSLILNIEKVYIKMLLFANKAHISQGPTTQCNTMCSNLMLALSYADTDFLNLFLLVCFGLYFMRNRSYSLIPIYHPLVFVSRPQVIISSGIVYITDFLNRLFGKVVKSGPKSSPQILKEVGNSTTKNAKSLAGNSVAEEVPGLVEDALTISKEAVRFRNPPKVVDFRKKMPAEKAPPELVIKGSVRLTPAELKAYHPKTQLYIYNKHWAKCALEDCGDSAGKRADVLKGIHNTLTLHDAKGFMTATTRPPTDEDIKAWQKAHPPIDRSTKSTEEDEA